MSDRTAPTNVADSKIERGATYLPEDGIGGVKVNSIDLPPPCLTYQSTLLRVCLARSKLPSENEQKEPPREQSKAGDA